MSSSDTILEKYQGSLARIFEKEKNVGLAYVFGSRAKGEGTDTSDLDLAVYFDSEPSLEELADLQKALEKLTGLEVDLSVLNDSGIIFTHQVLKKGELLFCRDEELRVRFESNAYRRYLDYKPFFESFNETRREAVFS